MKNEHFLKKENYFREIVLTIDQVQSGREKNALLSSLPIISSAFRAARSSKLSVVDDDDDDEEEEDDSLTFVTSKLMLLSSSYSYFSTNKNCGFLFWEFVVAFPWPCLLVYLALLV